jgi:hypothetical protein
MFLMEREWLCAAHGKGHVVGSAEFRASLLMQHWLYENALSSLGSYHHPHASWSTDQANQYKRRSLKFLSRFNYVRYSIIS